MNNIMIIVPHEDDEILMAAGIIERAVREKKRVTVVMATNGDYEGKDKNSGSVRLWETLEGLRVLGLSEESVIFMGYADTGMELAESFLYGLFMEKDETKIHPGHCSDETYALCSKPDFHSVKYGKPAPYTRRNFKKDLCEIIGEAAPDTIFTTSAEDIHGDHRGLFWFVKEILEEKAKEGIKPVLYSTVVHSRAGDENWPQRMEKIQGKGEELKSYTCPLHFNEGTLKWEERVAFRVPECMLSVDFSINKKAIALSRHKNALKEDAVEYLYSFIKAEEIFWEIKY